MKYRVLIFFLFFLNFCYVSFSQESIDLSPEERIQNSLDIILYEQILETSIQIQKERQQQIVSYQNLSGTFWVIEDVMLYPYGNGFETSAFVFLGNNIVLILRARPLGRSDGYRVHILYSIVTAREYNIIDGKLIILPGFIDGYLEDTYLFFGSSEVGYAKYRLECTFPSLR
jgi:hypothetical protein